MFDNWSDRQLVWFFCCFSSATWFGLGLLGGYMLGGNSILLATAVLGAGLGALLWIMHQMGLYVAGAEAQNEAKEQLDQIISVQIEQATSLAKRIGVLQ